MKNMFKRGQFGQGMTEYIIIVGMVAIAAIAAYMMFGSTVRDGTASNANAMTRSHLVEGGRVNGVQVSAEEAAKIAAANGAVDMAAVNAARAAGGAGASAAAAAAMGDAKNAPVVMSDDSVWDNSASVQVKQAPGLKAQEEEGGNLLVFIAIVLAVLAAMYMFFGDSGKGSSAGGGANLGQFEGSIENSTGQGGGSGAFVPSFGGGGSGGGGVMVDNSRDLGSGGGFQSDTSKPYVHPKAQTLAGADYPTAAKTAGSDFPAVPSKTGLKRSSGVADS